MTESESGYSLSSHDNIDDIADITYDELYTKVKEAIHYNGFENTQNDMYSSFLKRVDPKDTLSNAPPHVPAPSLGTIETRRKRSKSRSSSTERLLKLSIEQKIDIAQREIDELTDEIEKHNEFSEKTIDQYNAVVQENELALNEMRKSDYEFERDIIKGAMNPRTGKILAEKVQRYFENQLGAHDATVKALRLRNNTLKGLVKKNQQQLKQKEEMGEVLHVVDFNQLKIENTQYLEKIDEKNSELLRLKLMAGNTMQILNKYKKKLHQMTIERQGLKSDFEQRQKILESIAEESVIVEEEREKAEEENKRLRQQLADFKVPEVIQYVQDKSDLVELHRVVKSWRRKVEIAEMALKTHMKTWQKLTSTHQQDASWNEVLQGK